MKPIPKPVYPCECCTAYYSWPSDDLFWSDHDQAWVCDSCWDDRDIEEEKGICLTDELQRSKTRMKTRFDLEQAIMNTWSDNDSLLLIINNFDELDYDQQANLLIGHHALMELKMEALFGIFEELVHSKGI